MKMQITTMMVTKSSQKDTEIERKNQKIVWQYECYGSMIVRPLEAHQYTLIMKHRSHGSGTGRNLRIRLVFIKIKSLVISCTYVCVKKCLCGVN